LNTYIWDVPSGTKGFPTNWGEFDYLASTFEEWHLYEGIEPNVDYGKPIIRFRGWTVEKLSHWHCPPSISQTIVDSAVQEIIRKFAGMNDILFYGATVFCKDGISTDFSFLAPRNDISCIDFEKSDLDLDEALEDVTSIFNWRRLYFRPNCLGKNHIVWERHLAGRIVVSEPLRDAILTLKDPGICFTRPEDYKWR
jgi:hypothetical protein